jgi:hypothetical protein
LDQKIARDSPAFDSMPAVWRKMTPQTRQELINTIDTMCATASQDEKLWTKDRAMILLQFAPLTNRNNLHVSYFLLKRILKLLMRVLLILQMMMMLVMMTKMTRKGIMCRIQVKILGKLT